MTPRITHKRRLERAGFVFIAGWVPDNRFAAQMRTHIDSYRDEAQRIATTPKPSGRPKKETK